MRHPTKAQSLERLKTLGLPIGTIIDVGVLNGTYELSAGFPDKMHLLLEPIVEWNESIAKAYRYIKHELVNVAVSDSVGTAVMEVYSVKAGMEISHANLTDAKRPPAPGLATREVATSTLDQLVAERNLERPYLLKIDVDGAEAKVLAGAKRALHDCSIVIVEAQMHSFMQRATMLLEAGFVLKDLVDLCYYDGLLYQFDMVFLNRRFMEGAGLSVFPREIDISKYEQYTPQNSR